jgi:hypothetical protein
MVVVKSRKGSASALFEGGSSAASSRPAAADLINNKALQGSLSAKNAAAAKAAAAAGAAGGDRAARVAAAKAAKADLAQIKNVKDLPNLQKAMGTKKLNGKSLDEVAAQPDVINAAAKNQDKLKKLGMAGLGAAGLAALMIKYGTLNPVEAIEKALADAADAAADTGSSIFKKLFSSFQGAMGVSALFCFIICVIVIMWMVGSALLS